jgi:hypothetical protein
MAAATRARISVLVSPNGPMSTDKADLGPVIVCRFMSATGADGRPERTRLLHEDLVVSSAGGLPFSGEYRGPQGFFDLMGDRTRRVGAGLT